jgi:hypothetical protein
MRSTTVLSSFVFLSVLAVGCGDAGSNAPGASAAGPEGGAAGESGSAGSTAGTSGAAGKAGGGGSTAAGSSGSSGATAGGAGGTAGGAGGTSGASGSSGNAGASGNNAGASGASAGNSGGGTGGGSGSGGAPAGQGGSTSGSAGTSGAAGTAGGGTTGGTAGGGASGASGSAGTGGTKPLPLCDGGVVCPDDQYCDFYNDACLVENTIAECKPRPVDCASGGRPICACDGSTWESACFARKAGFDVADDLSCPPPSGYFGCGHLFCKVDEEYCAHMPDPVGIADGWECYPMPSVCNGMPDCDCLSQAICGPDCSMTAEGGYVLTCGG